jgi:hypothetical protein
MSFENYGYASRKGMINQDNKTYRAVSEYYGFGLPE